MSLTTFSGPVFSQNGFLDTSFTTAERDAIVDPQAGLLIYNTDVNQYQVYNGTGWEPAFIGDPTVASISPSVGAAAGGTNVTITGSNLTGATAVTIGGTAVASFTVVNATTITAVTAAHAAGANQSVLVTTPNGTNIANTLFTYVAAPTVGSVSPSTGSVDGGEPVTVTGTNLTGATSVTFGGVAATSVVVVNSTTITCDTPAGTAGAVAVAVTTPGGTGSLSDAFTYEAAGPVTYTENVDYGTGALQVLTMGSTSLSTNVAYWVPGSTDVTTFTSQPSGTAYTFVRSGTTYTFTTDAAWSTESGTATVTGVLTGTPPFAGGPPYNIAAITFTPA